MTRALEIAIAGLGLLLLTPLLAAIALAIKLCDGGPVFFSQQRVGQFGRPFRMHKFRTMVPHAERLGAQLTVEGDSRITRVGWWLRRTKLDELPQLMNVFSGEMSFVGPRPEVPMYVAIYTDEQRRVLASRPGITDPASLTFFDEAERLATSRNPERMYRDEIMPEKIRLNLAYAERRNAVSDLQVIRATLLRMCNATGLRRMRFAAPVASSPRPGSLTN